MAKSVNVDKLIFYTILLVVAFLVINEIDKSYAENIFLICNRKCNQIYSIFEHQQTIWKCIKKCEFILRNRHDVF